MFTRIKSTSNSPRKSVQICECRREDGKVRQYVVQHVGIADNDQHLEELKLLAEVLKRQIEQERAGPTLFDLPEKPPEEKGEKQIPQKKIPQHCPQVLHLDFGQMKEVSRTVEGFHETFGVLFNQLGLNKILPRKQSEILKDLLLARIADPGSKRYTQAILAADFGRDIPLDRIYRLMDKLICHKEQFQKAVFAATEQMCFGEISLLLFDVTTLYFESIQEDSLRDFGFSKDKKFNTTQVVLALATAANGLPVGYRLFKGDTAEVSTLLNCLEDWKKTLAIGKTLLVADRGMMSEKNIDALEQAGIQYVIAAKLKKLPKAIRASILEGPRQSEAAKMAIQDQILPNDRRLIVSHSLARQAKDESDRTRGIERLCKKIGKGKNLKKLIPNYGYQKFLKVEGEGKLSLDAEKTAKDSEWDGFHGVITNIKDKPVEELLSHYQRLWVIEESFRLHKHNLKIRPIYHFNPERIEAHILICYLSFALIRHMEKRLEIQQEKISIEQMKKALWRVQASLLTNLETKKWYRMPSNMSVEAKKIYQTLNIKRRLSPEEIIK